MRRLGLKTERTWHQQTPQGTVAVVYLEADDLGRVFEGIATSDDPFVVWGLVLWGAISAVAFGYLARAMGSAGARLAVDGPSPELGVRLRNLVWLSRVLLAGDDPGIGLRDNGRRVLTYADLRSIREPDDNRAPTREIELHLTGNMERYMWSLNGKKFADAEPIRVRYGERVRQKLRTPMPLIDVFQDLGYVTREQVSDTLRKNTLSIRIGDFLVEPEDDSNRYRPSLDRLGDYVESVLADVDRQEKRAAKKAKREGK